MDAGPMLARRSRPIGPDETSEDVERDLAESGAALLLTVVDDLAAGRAHEEPQDHAQATFAPRLTKDDGRIDWSAPAGAVHNLVRGLHPWPHAFTFLDSGRYLILRTTVAPGSTTAREVDLPQTPEPGQILVAGGDRLLVATGGGGAVAVLEIQPDGRRRQSAREFLAGYRVTAGAVFRSQQNPR